MKATNSSTNTLFMEIFLELLEIAKAYFQELFKNADPGTYTVKDIYAFIEKNIKATKEDKLTGVGSYFFDRYTKTLKKSPYYTKVDRFGIYSITYLCRVTGNIVSIEKGNFKCSFDIIKVFEYLERFKKLSGAKDKLEFTKETEIKEGQKSTSFEIELSKEDIKSLTSVKTEKNDIMNRYTENTAHLSLTDSMMYVTNCFVFKAKKVNVKNVLDETKDILISFDVLKNIGAGNCNFTVTEGEEIYNVVVKNTATDKIVPYSFKKQEKFLDYKSVFPKLYKEMSVCLKDTKSFVDCIKTQQKTCNKFGLSYFMIQIIKGSKEIKVIACNEVDYIGDNHKFSEFSFELKESAEFSGCYFYVFDKILKCLDDWNGNLCFDETKLSFGMKAVNTCFCMGALDINKFFDKYSIVTVKPDKLTKIENDIALEQKNNDDTPLNDCNKQNKDNLDTKNFRITWCDKCFEPIVKNEIYYSVFLKKDNQIDIHTIINKNFKVKIVENSIEKTVNANINEIEKTLYDFVLKRICEYYKIDINQNGVTVISLNEGHKYEYRNIYEAYFNLFDKIPLNFYKNHLDNIYKDRLKEGDCIEFNLSRKAGAPTYIGFVSNDPGLGLVCIIDDQKFEVGKMVNLKVLKPKENETILSTQSGKESALKQKGTNNIEEFNTNILTDIDKNTYNVSEGNECTFILKPKETCAIDYIQIGKELIKGDGFKVVGRSGRKYCILFDGESIETSLFHTDKNVRQEETIKVFTYLGEKGYSWEQPDNTKFYLIDKEREYLFKNEFEAYLFLKDGSIQLKETKSIIKYTDDMLELVSLDLDSMTYVVNGDIGMEKDIASIVLYDKIGKIVAFCDDGEKIECQFDGESILQSVINEISGNSK